MSLNRRSTGETPKFPVARGVLTSWYFHMWLTRDLRNLDVAKANLGASKDLFQRWPSGSGCCQSHGVCPRRHEVCDSPRTQPGPNLCGSPLGTPSSPTIGHHMTYSCFLGWVCWLMSTFGTNTSHKQHPVRHQLRGCSSSSTAMRFSSMGTWPQTPRSQTAGPTAPGTGTTQKFTEPSSRSKPRSHPNKHQHTHTSQVATEPDRHSPRKSVGL